MGRTYIYFGTPGFGGSPNLVMTGEADGDYFGTAVATGDVNGDGVADVLVSAPFHAGAGRVYAYYGGPGIDAGVDRLCQDLPGGNLGNGSQNLASADVTGDGIDDIVAGSASANRVCIYSGGLTSSAPNVVLHGENPTDSFGTAVGLGDFCGDGSMDIVVGAPQIGQPGPGKAYIYMGGVTLHDAPLDILTGSPSFKYFGLVATSTGRFLGSEKSSFVVIDYYVPSGVQTGGHANVFTCSGQAAPTPPRIQAWWTFDDLVSPTTMRDIVHPTSNLNVGTLTGAATRVPGELSSGLRCLSGTDGMTTQSTNNSLFIGGCGFGIEAWIKLFPGSTAGAVRTIFKSSSGFNFYIQNGRLGLGSLLATMSPLPIGEWHHVAVTTTTNCLGPAHTTFFVDGVRVTTSPLSTSYSDAGIVYIGGGPAAPALNGILDELTVFRSSVQGIARDTTVIRKIWAAGSAGKRREYIRFPLWVSLSGTLGASTSICGVLTNMSGTSKTYQWALSQLSGSNSYMPSGGTVTVSSAPGTLAIKVVRGSYPVFYFRVQATSAQAPQFFTESGVTSSAAMGVLVNGCLFPTLAKSHGAVASSQRADPDHASSSAQFTVRNDSTVALPFSYRIEAVDADSQQPSEDISLDGLPPGTPVTGTVTVQAGDSAGIAVDVFVDANTPFRTDQLVLSADVDGDAVLEPLASSLIEAAEDTLGPVLSTPAASAQRTLLLRATPNPFHAGLTVRFELATPSQVDLEVYDVAGRHVQTLASGPMAAGSHAYEWKSTAAAAPVLGAGIYFIRLTAGGAHATLKAIRLE